MKEIKMDKILVRNYILFVAILLICVGVLGYVLVSGEEAIDETDNWVLHSHEVITEAEGLSKLIEGLIAAQRGFLLTGEDHFMNEYESKKAKAFEHIESLKTMTGDNRSQQERLGDLNSNFKLFATKLEDRAEEFSGQVSKTILRDVESLNEIKSTLISSNEDFLSKEYDLLDQRIKEVDHKKGQYFSTLLIVMVVGTAVLLLLNGYLLNINRRRSLAEATLKDSEDRFALALEGTQDGIYDWDIKSGKIFYSRRFFEMLGQDNGGRIGVLEDSLKLVHPDDVERLQGFIDQYLSGELSEFSQEFRLRHKSGRWVWVQSRARALFDDNGKAYRMVGANSDITHLKYEQERLEAEKINAERANIAKSEFLAHMSHEIRTPLTAVSGIAEIFERNQSNLDDKQKQLIRTLNSSTETLKDLVNDILDFSKIESGELELDEKAFRLDHVFAQVISIMSVRANEKGISFVCAEDDIKNVDFYGDQHRLRQILVNLIGNAIKFTNTGGSVKVIPTFEVRDDEEFLRIDVKDTGIGIDAEHVDIVFEKFKQADASVSRKYGGTGLGLPISRNLAQLMGGNIILSSKKGEGSTFSVLLPMKLSRSDETSQEKKDTNKKMSDKIQSELNDTHKALLVEDYEGNIVVVGYILDEIGLEYDIAKNGREAVEHWNERHYDVVLMDVQMPEMDGFAATKAIREAEEKKDLARTPIIGMTAHALVGDKDKCIEAGMDAYLPKPIVEADLKKEIFKYLGKRKKAA